jgi:Cu-Zn family superoxide dismutase
MHTIAPARTGVRRAALALCLLTAGLAAGCGSVNLGMDKPMVMATAQLRATTGNNASGTVRFAQQAGKVMISGQVSGLKPNAEHGFHVHEKGDCSSGDGMSTGGHFNPGGAAHGRHGAGAHHVGDLPSLKADANGVAQFRFETSSVTLGSGAADVIGKGLIVHRDPDDYRTQPTGNAGPRLACAVIMKS